MFLIKGFGIWIRILGLGFCDLPKGLGFWRRVGV